MQKRILTWADVDRPLRRLALELYQTNKPVWGLPRGGRLVVDLMQQWQPELKVEYDREPSYEAIIVDDIADSGLTLVGIAWIDCNPYRRFGALYRRYSCVAVVDYVGAEEESDDYLVFPWEGVELDVARAELGLAD